MKESVNVWEEDILLPTYGIGRPEKNPMFLEKRVYQGSSGVVYPYPVIEKIEDTCEEKVAVNKNLSDVGELPFEGTGAVFKGFVNAKDDKYVAKVEMYLDGELVETANLPASYTTRRNDLFWKYQLPKGKHTATFKWLNPRNDVSVHFGEILIYSDAPKEIVHQ